MSKKEKAFDEPSPGELDDYVPAVFARSFDEAEKYRQLLEDHDVPAIIDEDYDPPKPGARIAGGERVPVLVPEPMLEDAKGFIADMEDMNDLVEDEAYLDGDDEDEFGADDDFEADEEAEEL